MIFITGQHGAGKTHFARLYQENLGYCFVDLGPTLRQVWQETGTELNFGDFIGSGEKKHGPNFTDNLLALEIEKNLRVIKEEGGRRDLLVIGSRSIGGINYLRENIPVVNGRPRKIVFIEAREELLFSRYKAREGKNISYGEFLAILEKDAKMGVLGIRQYADWVISNNGNLGEFDSKCLGIHTSLEGGIFQSKER